MDEERFEFDVALPMSGGDLAAEIEQRLADLAAEDVRRKESVLLLRSEDVHGRDTRRVEVPDLNLVVSALVGAYGLAALVLWVIHSRGCTVILDARGRTIRMQIEPGVPGGRLVILSRDDTKVQVVEVPKVVDLTGVIKAAVTANADAVREAAKAAGAKVDRDSPSDSRPGRTGAPKE